MAIIDITNAIARMEDHTWDAEQGTWGTVNPNSLAQKNNNPGNLRYNPAHPEYTPRAVGGGAGGFARYTNVEDGLADLERQIGIDANRGLDLESFVNKYAPPSENKTSVYLANVMNWLGVGGKTKLTDIISDSGAGADETPIDVGDGDGSEDAFSDPITLVGIAVVLIGGYFLFK